MDEYSLGIMRALPVSAWLKDRRGKYVYLNAHAAKLFGVDAVGVTAHQLFTPETALELELADQRVVAAGAPVILPIWVTGTSASRAQFCIVKFPVELADDHFIGGLGIDITHFSPANWDASTFRQILDAITDMILVKGPRSKLRWANKAFLDGYGMSNEDLQGLIDAAFVEPDITAEYVKDDARVFATGRPLDIPEELMKLADGRVRTVHTVKSPIFDASGGVAMTVAVIRDTTERRHLELELRQAQKLESIGRLAAGVAHEINTPIQFIGDQATFAQEATTELLGLVAHYRTLVGKVEAGTATRADAEAARAAEADADLDQLTKHLPLAFVSIREGTRRVGSLVRAMKEFGHPDSSSKQPADLNTAIRNAVMVSTSEHKYVADVVLELGDLPEVTCVIGELNQVFLNLIVNAAHTISNVTAGTAGARGQILIKSRIDGDDAVVEIGDTGEGIAEEVQARIFEPFFTTKEIGRGTGQGLAISRSIVVDKHRGSLSFETELGRGTTFIVRIPWLPSVAAAAA
ncbi:MAG: PAS domain-containing protein [Kofleriaceae bacterium]